VTSQTESPFLTAAWRHLALANFRVDPELLQPLVPRGTELDAWEGATHASLVGFLFEDVRVLGVPVPLHQSFEEVNLRFYVRRRGPQGWRRAVVFVKEIVPRRAVAYVARALYGENYVALPMAHACTAGFTEYSWTHAGRQHGLSLRAGPFHTFAAGSEAEFLVEHYWGYSARRDGTTTEYRVEHPPWRVAEALEARLDWDPGELYGEPLGLALDRPPDSAFLAEGSEVVVYRGVEVEA
jgi:uncharacterized protein YqjF (DUF2071 family)